MATQVNRLVGNYAACAVALTANQTTGLLIAQLVNWEATIETEFADATGHGDLFEVPVVIRQRWTARCEGFLTEASRITFMTSWSTTATGVPKKVTLHTFIGYNDYLNLTTPDTEAKVIFRGNCYPQIATLRLPDGMSSQEISFRGAGDPNFIGPYLS